MEGTLISDIFGILLAIGVGLGCGSYATMPYYRLPNGLACAGQWTGEKAACPSCGHVLRTRDLLPLINWFITKGKCQFCCHKINKIYFFIELGCVVVSLLAYFTFGFEHLHMYLFVLGLGVCLVIASAIDFTYHIIPDTLFTVMLLCAFLYLDNSMDSFFDTVYVFTVAVLIGVVTSKLYPKLTGKELANYRYFKFIAVAGFWLPLLPFLQFLGLSLLLYIPLWCLYRMCHAEKPYAFALAQAIALLAMVLR